MVGDALGISFQQVQKYGRGANRISASVLVKAAEALRSTVTALVGADASEPAGVASPSRARMPPRAPSLGLPRERRLRRARDFRQLYARGKRFSQERISAVVQPNDQGAARLGLSIAARVLRRAVQRNRMRRLIRESFRLHQRGLPALDIVIGLRSAPGDTDDQQIRRSLEKLWQRLAACKL